jgi:hypothetical protein
MNFLELRKAEVQLRRISLLRRLSESYVCRATHSDTLHKNPQRIWSGLGLPPEPPPGLSLCALSFASSSRSGVGLTPTLLFLGRFGSLSRLCECVQFST